MPININYSRKIAKLLKVIGCDKEKNWLKGNFHDEKFFLCNNLMPRAAAATATTLRLECMMMLPSFTDSRWCWDEKQRRNYFLLDWESLDWWKNFFHCFIPRSDIFPAFPFIFFPREQTLWKTMAWNSEWKRKNSRKIQLKAIFLPPPPPPPRCCLMKGLRDE